jgi:hypothetical protein
MKYNHITIQIQRMQQTWHTILLPQKPLHVCCTADLGVKQARVSRAPV